MSTTVYILNGPNLNLLGKREPHLYGHQTLDDVKELCETAAKDLGVSIRFLQSNAEHQLIDWIHEARDRAAAIVINPAAYTHTSVAILDALKAFDGPVVEIHISDVHKREDFRKHSYVSLRANEVIAGKGVEGYVLGLKRAVELYKALIS